LSLSIFDKSFAVTYALEAAAMLIGLFGLAVTLAASVCLRARELATLGAPRFQPPHAEPRGDARRRADRRRRPVIGLACGIAIGAILTQVINPQAFHWRMSLTFPGRPCWSAPRRPWPRPCSPATTPRARRPGCRWRRSWPAPSKRHLPMRRRRFLATPLLLPLLARAAAMETPVAYPPVTPGAG
jgi:hypothetical protein